MAIAILVEAALSFLGVGVRPPTPPLGLMLSDGRGFMLQAPWVVIFPGLAIVAAVLGFNMLADGLRDWLDPQERAQKKNRICLLIPRPAPPGAVGPVPAPSSGFAFHRAPAGGRRPRTPVSAPLLPRAA